LHCDDLFAPQSARPAKRSLSPAKRLMHFH
jgi:hypothetical protein